MTESEEAFLVFMADPPPGMEVEWNTWYNTRHLPARLRVPGFMSGHRYEALRGGPKYLTIYQLAGVDVLTSDAYLRLRRSEAALPSDSFEAITMQQRLPNTRRGLYKSVSPLSSEDAPIGARVILVLGYDTQEDEERQFVAWYEREFLTIANHSAGFVATRRLVAADVQLSPESGARFSGPRHLTICELAGDHALRSEAFARIWELHEGRGDSAVWDCLLRIAARRIGPSRGANHASE